MPNWTHSPFNGHRSEPDTDGDTQGEEIFNSQTDTKPTPVTYHKDGGKTYHLGGPCGDLYVDRNGES